MPRMSKVELFAAIRRESRMGRSGRAIATKYRVSRHTVSDALASAWPRERDGRGACSISVVRSRLSRR